MPPEHDTLDSYIDAAAEVLALPVEPAWKPAIRSQPAGDAAAGGGGGRARASRRGRARPRVRGLAAADGPVDLCRRDRQSRGGRRDDGAGGSRGGAGAHRRPQSAAQRLHRGDAGTGCWPKARAIDARAPRASRWGPWRACRSPSRTCSTSPDCQLSRAPRSTASVARPPPMPTLIERLEAAGAVLVGALNMGEYAYDFTGENVHDGPSRNPHDTAHMTGRLLRRLGRSGGRRTGAAVAGVRHQRLDPCAVVVLRACSG